MVVALRLNGGTGTNEFEGGISTTAQVALASLTHDGVMEASELGVVPYGEGRLTLRRSSKGSGTAKATEHYFGGKSRASWLDVHQGVVEIQLRERNEAGTPLEWVQIEIQA